MVHHHLYSVTSKDVVDLLHVYEPERILLEQVHGFTLPTESGSAETPKQRLGFGLVQLKDISQTKGSKRLKGLPNEFNSEPNLIKSNLFVFKCFFSLILFLDSGVC